MWKTRLSLCIYYLSRSTTLVETMLESSVSVDQIAPVDLARLFPQAPEPVPCGNVEKNSVSP